VKATAADDDSILHVACTRVGLNPSAARLLHQHATGIWLLPADQTVARISRSSDDRGRIARAVTVTRWLAAQGFPVTMPADVDQPIEVNSACVTFWRYYPQGDRPTPGAAALGRLLRQLHELPQPPVTLDDYVPLVRLGNALTSNPPLADDDLAWLAEHRIRLVVAYRELHSQLGVGWIHGDAYPGNTLWNGEQVILGDWDEIARGPRELDLINTHQGVRMGRSDVERRAFTSAYGWDVTAWPGFLVLRQLRDLHTLGAYIERASHDDSIAIDELNHRIRTLRANDTTARWNAR
jgi:aminoglycoside phosphotransferase (APT) family kinase protein